MGKRAKTDYYLKQGLHLHDVSRPNMKAIDIDSLTPAERLDLLERIWDSLSAAPEAIPLTQAQRQELDRRLDDLEREGPVGIPWDDVLRAIKKRNTP